MFPAQACRSQKNWRFLSKPAQKQFLIDNLDNDEIVDIAIDELIRYVTPVMGFIRTVTRDHTYRNTDLKEGDRVLMLYGSANRDSRQNIGSCCGLKCRPSPVLSTVSSTMQGVFIGWRGAVRPVPQVWVPHTVSMSLLYANRANC